MSTVDSVSGLLLTAMARSSRLEADDERDLIDRYRRGDQAAFGRLILANVRLAVKRARDLRGYRLPENDLVQEGVIGLIEAASRFDPQRDLRFSTYARWWIKATTTEFVLRNWSLVPTALSGEQKSLFFNVRRMRDKLLRDPSIDPATVHNAIAAALGVSERDVAIMEARLAGDVRLNAPAPWDEDGGTEIGDNLPDEASLIADFATDFDDDEREAALHDALGRLDDRERLIIQERWLTEDIAPLSALGEFLGITAPTVKRIEVDALAKIQGLIVRTNPQAFAA